MLKSIEERHGVDRYARAPGVVREATPEGQDEDGGGEAGAPIDQKLYSTPICTRRGSLTTSPGAPTVKVCCAGTTVML